MSRVYVPSDIVAVIPAGLSERSLWSGMGGISGATDCRGGFVTSNSVRMGAFLAFGRSVVVGVVVNLAGLFVRFRSLGECEDWSEDLDRPPSSEVPSDEDREAFRHVVLWVLNEDVPSPWSFCLVAVPGDGS